MRWTAVGRNKFENRSAFIAKSVKKYKETITDSIVFSVWFFQSQIMESRPVCRMICRNCYCYSITKQSICYFLLALNHWFRTFFSFSFFLVIAVILSIGTVMAMASASVVKSDQAISVAKHVDCERQCPYYYFPICATNGNPAENRMFVNICEMHAWNCDVEKSKQMQTGHAL